MSSIFIHSKVYFLGEIWNENTVLVIQHYVLISWMLTTTRNNGWESLSSEKERQKFLIYLTIANTLRYTCFEVVFASPAGYFLVLSWKAGKAEWPLAGTSPLSLTSVSPPGTHRLLLSPLALFIWPVIFDLLLVQDNSLNHIYQLTDALLRWTPRQSLQ